MSSVAWGEDVEPRRFLAIDIHVDLQAIHLLVAGDIGQLRQRPNFLDELWHPLRELGRIRTLEQVLPLERQFGQISGLFALT